jgi:hypothetical protein
VHFKDSNTEVIHLKQRYFNARKKVDIKNVENIKLFQTKQNKKKTKQKQDE